MEEILELLRRKTQKYGEEHIEIVREHLKKSLEAVYHRNPSFAKQFVESVPSSYLKDLDNLEVLERTLKSSITVLEATIEPAEDLTRILLDLILAANRRCHTSTKYHVHHAINNIGRRIGIYDVARAAQELSFIIGKPSRSNIFRFVRALLLYAHPRVRFPLEEAIRHHKIAGVAYLSHLPEFPKEWIKILRGGGDVRLNKDLHGEFRVGNKLIFLTDSLRRTLEAFDSHHSCFSPHYSSTSFITVLKHPAVITVVVLGKKGRILARINGYYDRDKNKFFVGSKIYGNLSRREALEIFKRIKEEGSVEVYVPTYYFDKPVKGRDVRIKVREPPLFGLSDDFVVFGDEIHAKNVVKI